LGKDFVLCSKASRKKQMVRVFVTGVYGSGKTYFAKEYADQNNVEYIDFDGLFDYTVLEAERCEKILADLPDAFVIDAIPIDEHQSWKRFSEYEAKNDVEIICIYCPDKDEWLERVHAKLKADYELAKAARRAAEHHSLGVWVKVQLRKTEKRLKQLGILFIGWLRKLGWVLKHPKVLFSAKTAKTISSQIRETWNTDEQKAGFPGIDESKHRQKYRNFFNTNLHWLDQFKNVKFYDSVNCEFTSKELMLERIGHRFFPLEDRLDSLPENYDRTYQDIEPLNFVGYSQSYKSWERFKDLLDWTGKTTVDLGCNHGYFAFKVEDSGGIAIGFDRSGSVLDTARMINELRGGNVVFEEWSGGDTIPECDVILCLNVLHHFDNPDHVVSTMNCKMAIFEIYAKDRPTVEKYFKVVEEAESHRSDRTILLCERIG
jgi:2-polyprenyl-3-methyl-5-hydroxy-6-metoxy-1,4-benzoquinol methylase